MRYRAYTQYTPVNNLWLEQIPVNWKVAKLKFFLANNDGGVWGEEGDSSDTMVLRSTEITLSGKWAISNPEYRKLKGAEFEKSLLLENDLLVTKSSGSVKHIGKTAIVSKKVANFYPAFSNFMQRLRCDINLNPQFLYYIINNSFGKEQVNFLSSTTTGLRNLNGGILGNLSLAVPRIEEQEQIATFLDRETAVIDTLIAKQEELIGLLKEKRTAVISTAVTKGINPHAPLKDSGIEWLGQIPAHWAVLPMRRISTSLEQGWSPVAENRLAIEGEWAVIKLNAVKNGEFHENAQKTLSLNTSRPSHLLLNKGDFLMTRANTPLLVGDVCVIGETPSNVILSDLVYRVGLNEHIINPHFLSYALLSTIGRIQIESRAHGSNHSMVKISQRHILELLIPILSLEEQCSIVAYLDIQVAKLKKLQQESFNMIDLLKERRTALISAAVTGKIDVRQT